MGSVGLATGRGVARACATGPSRIGRCVAALSTRSHDGETPRPNHAATDRARATQRIEDVVARCALAGAVFSGHPLQLYHPLAARAAKRPRGSRQRRDRRVQCTSPRHPSVLGEVRLHDAAGAPSSQVKSGQVRPSQVKSGQVRPSRAKSGQVRSSQAKSGQVGSSRVKSGQVGSSRVKSKSSRVRSSQVESSRVKSSQVESSRDKSSQVESSRVELSQVESS